MTAPWFSAIERDAGRYSVVFLHLGEAFEPYRHQLDNLGGVAMSVQDYLSKKDSSDHELIVLTDVEYCATSRKHSLGQLRAAVLNDIDSSSHKFILISSIARSAFPTIPGSDLLADAKHVFANPLPADDECQGIATLPGWNGGGETKETFLATCISELSAETVVNLGEFIWDLGLSPNECMDALAPLDKESLRGAGLVAVSAERQSWVIDADWKSFRGAVAIASSRFMQTADWLANSFVDLWLIERQLRNAIRDALMERSGAAWRSSCASPEMATELVERARKDVQPRAEKIEDLRDPLEWLTTSELLDLRESRQLGGLGLEPYMWTKLRADLLPIRNRAAHMRVVSERDARTAATWRKLVMTKL